MIYFSFFPPNFLFFLSNFGSDFFFFFFFFFVGAQKKITNLNMFGVNLENTSITKISVTLNVLNLVKNIFSCGFIHKGNFLKSNKDILLDVRKLPL